MPITQDQLEGLSKQVFMLEYLLNGLFPCQSDVVRLIRAKKREWAFNDKFEYRMLLATTNTGGSLNSQVFKENVGLIKPGELDYGTFRASYGSVADGFNVDMFVNLETKEKRAAFENDYAMRMHSLRINVASLFKNFAIHGQYGVVHQLRDTIAAPNIDPVRNPQPNVGFTPVAATPFTIAVPINVFQSNFKRGKYLIKTARGSTTSGHAPDGPANIAERYLVLDNQPLRLTLLSVGTAISEWQNGEYLEVDGNRESAGGPNDPTFLNWTAGAITVANTSPWAGTYDQFTGTGAYSTGVNAIIGSMEGLADLFPWYTDPGDTGITGSFSSRLLLDRPFRDQPNRLRYSTEQAGGFIIQEENEHIIDCIMRGSFLTKSTVPYADIGIWINPVTRAKMGYEEGEGARVIRDNFVAGPIVYQRGIQTHDYQIGNQTVREVVEDENMPTDVIIIGPKDDMSYNCWDNSVFEIDSYIQETWAKSAPPRVEDIAIPDEIITKLDLSKRITFGSPSLGDGNLSSFTYGNRIRHPRNQIPVAMHEAGALFTEYPYTYTVIKLREPIVDLPTT
jgi:hypothetical protein